MELDKLNDKLARWTLLSQEYDFEVNCNIETILKWHESIYLALISYSIIMVLSQSLDKKLDRNKVISNM
uniref:Uncharacterized protein n=2 Tax=Physcomitrium patens TaxID=3218 RepID=A0A2K1K3Q7_PHYPA|nr:hypothetical protein PHYPA_012891 [Physcomitrium patens]